MIKKKPLGKRREKKEEPRLGYSLNRPTSPGWYWVLNEHHDPSQLWEAIVRVDEIGGELWCSWLATPGFASMMKLTDTGEHCLWFGPLVQPSQLGNAFCRFEP